MDAVFHAGELLVQERAGVRERAARIGGSIRDEIPPVAADFLAQRRFVVLAAADRAGRPWASIAGGPPGFARATGPRSVRLDAVAAPGDPLAGAVARSGHAGLLALDLATRRRMRINGRLAPAEGAILLEAEQVYSNCPKYIRPREAEFLLAARRSAAAASTGLSDPQRAWIRGADTFFIATVNPGEGADASHRGGEAGFVQVDGNRLTWPEYAGNMMYNTLGNIVSFPRAGVLVPDFTSGAMLLMTGVARIDWQGAGSHAGTGTHRVVELDVEEVMELR
jgi:predicted pyridoxine 5'-phosphate oxidase superfamily flavin-nucleotide-binding protein